MSIRNENDEFVAVCECGEEIAGWCEEGFRAFILNIKDAGWKISKNENGEWVHTCPECQES
jgi:hypothetical protein